MMAYADNYSAPEQDEDRVTTQRQPEWSRVTRFGWINNPRQPSYSLLIKRGPAWPYRLMMGGANREQ